MTKVKQLADYSGQTVYVGIDVHLKNWDISVFLNKQHIRSFHQEANSDRLINTLKGDYTNAKIECAYEAGFSGFWLYRNLTEQGINCIVVNAADVPQSDKDKKTKTDRGDSKKIAQALEAGQLRPINVPDKRTESDRKLLRLRQQSVADLTRSKNRIKHFLYYNGVIIPKQFQKNNWSNIFIKWLKELKFNYENEKYALDIMIAKVEEQNAQIISLKRKINELLINEHYKKFAQSLLSVPGIGRLTAAILLVEIGGINRFPTFVKFNSYIGFYPGEYSSGKTEKKGHIISRHHTILRSLFIEAAWRAVKTDPALTLAFAELKKRMTAKRAIIRIARKLLSRVYFVWKNDQKYEKGVLI